MQTLLLTAAVPFLLIVLSLLLPSGKSLRRTIGTLEWLQPLVVLYLYWPLLSGAQEVMEFDSNLCLERLGAYFVVLTSVAVACCISHADHYFEHDPQKDILNHMKMFYACTNIFLLSMTAVYFCNNLGLLWIFMEFATLSSAPLVYFHRTKNALEATWKYLIICSVGIAFALLGTIFIFAASQNGGSGEGSLRISELCSMAPGLNYAMLRFGFIFCVIGYGTKAGIFPLHNWLPDAYSESPPPASGMFSGGFTNCALFGIWKVSSILNAAHHHDLVFGTLATFGAITALFGGLFLIRQRNLCRMWAYSSIENVGIIIVAIGLGSGALFFLQALNHSISKIAIFLLSGNIVQAAHTQRLRSLHGVLQASPVWGGLLALSSLALCGVPPFGAFVSEISIFSESLKSGSWALVACLIAAVSISFVAINTHVARILFGVPRADFKVDKTLQTSIVPGLLLLAALLLGITLRPGFWRILH